MTSALRIATRCGRRCNSAPFSVARTFASSPRLRSGSAPFFPNEPSAPIVQTSSFPAANNKAAAEELAQVFDLRSMNMMADYDASIGNLYDSL